MRASIGSTHPHLWAKTDREGRTTSYHPLICHLVDVAMVAETMWDNVMKPGVRRWAASELQMSEADTRQWISFLAGLHDIGKACPSFQRMFSSAESLMQERGYPLGRLQNKDAPHGIVSAVVLRDILSTTYDLTAPVANALATAIGGHHGTFPSSREQQDLYDELTRKPWVDWRRELVATLATVVGVPESFPAKRLNHSMAMWLAGLVSVADWIGSNTDYFHLIHDYNSLPDEIDLDAYVQMSRTQAEAALTELGWIGWKTQVESTPWNDMFTFPPRPLQQAAIDIAPTIDSPNMVIVEAPMGEGKTEAAFYLSDYWAIDNGQQGLYIGLPTMATSNQMFTRVKEFLHGRYPNAIANLQLQHGHAALSEEFKELIERGKFQSEDLNVDDNPEGNVIAAEWFTYRKRGLLAPFGVGTIDQALLAVLQTRHVFVRLHGLAHKTLVLDEVHAYDTYMSTLIERLLEWCAALGTSVILLSATLPKNRRLALMAAYQRGLGVEPTNQISDQPYPRLSWVSGSEIRAKGFETSPEVAKTYDLTYVNGEIPNPPEPFELGFKLDEALSEGGCVAVICNTVRRAQQMYLALKEHFDPDEIDLLHARFLFGERDQREKRALQRFGKPGSKVTMADGSEVEVERPHRAVLVATQVIEQSLDLDFDLMVSDFAPVDLLLQRSGRLHRHQRDNRPKPSRDRAQLWVTEPPVKEGVPKFERGAAAIYDEHVLLRTWLTLNGVSNIKLPEDVEPLIESVYADSPPRPDLSPALLDYWHKTKVKQEAKRGLTTVKAKKNRIASPVDTDDILEDFNRELDEDDPTVNEQLQALTRLGEPSLTVVLAQENTQHSIEKRLNPDETTDVLKQTVRISGGALFKALVKLDPPDQWDKIPMLRHCRLLYLDDQHSVTEGGWEIRLHSELGVTIQNLERIR